MVNTVKPGETFSIKWDDFWKLYEAIQRGEKPTLTFKIGDNHMAVLLEEVYE
jgi:hypothetical protein